MNKLEFLVITGRWFTPGYRDGFTAASGIATRLIDYEEAEIGRVLESLKDKGFLEIADLNKRGRRIKDPGEPYYDKKPAIWLEREQLLHKRGMRHVVLQKQEDHSLEDLIVALLMTARIENEKESGSFLAQSTSKQIAELKVYLFRYAETDIMSACDALVEQGVAQKVQIKVEDEQHEGIDLTIRGTTYYKKKTMKELNLREDESILEIIEREEITIFWAWQSDYPKSRSTIEEKLKQVAKEANRDWNPVAPIRIQVARDPGEGALRIDVALQEKIAKADFFATDFTPVFQYRNRLYPNPNVLVEAGFALASKCCVARPVSAVVA